MQAWDKILGEMRNVAYVPMGVQNSPMPRTAAIGGDDPSASSAGKVSQGSAKRRKLNM